MVCSPNWNVISTLAGCLLSMDSRSDSEGELLHDEIRRLACLTLNNLSTPKQNKRAIMGEDSKLLLQNITTVIKLQIPETTYLCCIFLMNLSMSRDAVEPIMMFTPTTEGAPDLNASLRSSGRLRNSTTSIDSRNWEKFPTSKRFNAREPTPPRHRRATSDSPWLDDPNSLLRCLEKLIRDQQPFLMSKAFSVEGESIRWAIGLLRNLTVKHRHCVVIAKTEIPALVLEVIKRTPHPVKQWIDNSTEEMALTVLDQLAASPAGSDKLKDCGAKVLLNNIVNMVEATSTLPDSMAGAKNSSVSGRRICVSPNPALNSVRLKDGGNTIVRNKISSILEYLER